MNDAAITQAQTNYILIIDDSPVDVELTVDLLRKMAKLTFEYCHVITFSELDKALSERDWDLILCDFVMTALSAADAIRYVKQIQPQTPIILVSGLATVQNAVDMMRLGAHGFVEKMDHARLIALVKQELTVSRILKTAFETEKSLRISALRYQSLVENQTDFICRLDSDFRFTFVNRAYCNWCDQPVADIVGTNFLDRFSVENKDIVIGQLKALTIDNPTVITMQPPGLRDKANNWHWFEWTALVVFDDVGAFVEYQILGRDITKHKVLEEALRVKDSAIASSIIAIAIADLTGNLTYVNPAFLRLWKFENAQDIIGQSVLNFWEVPGEAQAVITAIQAHGQFSGTLMARLNDGSMADLELVANLVTDANGNPLCMMGSFSDITQRNRAEQALRRSEEKFSKVFAASPDAIAVTIIDRGLYLEVNDAFSQSLGYSREEIIGRSSLDLNVWVNLADRQQLIESLSAHKAIRNMETQFRRKSGEIEFALLSSELIDLDGIPCMLSIIKDITDRKSAEEALRASEEKYRSLIESSDATISMVDRNGVYLYLNQIAAIPFGVAPEALIGKTVRELFPANDADPIMADIERVIGSGNGLVLEPEVSLGGETRWFRTSMQPVKDKTGNPYAVLIHATEISDKKRAELALQQSLDQKQAILRAIPDIVFRANADGTFLDYHAPYGNQFARPAETFIGQKIEAVMVPEASERLLAGIRETIATQQEVQFDSSAFYWDKPRYFNTRLVPVDANTVQAIVRDETEQKQVERALQASEHRYRQLFEVHGLPKLILNPVTGAIVDANLAAGQFYGYDLPTLKTLTIFDLNLSPAAEMPEIMDKLNQAAALSLSITVVHRGADGQPHDVEVFSGPVEIDGQVLLFSIAIDVTEQKQAEKALQEAHDLLERRVIERTAELERVKNRIEAIFNHSGEAILLINNKEGIQQANYAFNALFNTSIDHYFGCPLSALVHPEDALTIETRIQQVFSTRHAQNIEIQALRIDGSTVEVEINIAPINSTNAPISNVVCIIRDVEMQKQAQQAMAEERNLLRTVIDVVPDFIYVKDFEHRMILNNLAHARSAGFSIPAPMLGKTDFDLFSHELATKFYADEVQLFQTEKALVNVEERSLGISGEEIWALTSKVPLRNLDGDLIGLVGITRDISHIKANETALRESEERFRQFIELAPISTIITDAAGAIVLVNKQAETLFGYDRGELIGQPVGLLIPGNLRGSHDQNIETYVAVPHRRRNRSMEVPALKKDGSTFPADIQLSYIETRPAPMVLCLILDATQRQQAETTLKQALAQEKELGELKSRFVSTASHEFRTPLATILAATETVKAYYDRMERSQIDARLEKIRQQVIHMTAIMDDVLQLTRIQSGRVEFNPVLIDFDALCQDVIDEFANHPQHQGRLVYTCAEHPVSANVDNRLMRQVISNLVSNALKYSSGEKLVHINLTQDASGMKLIVQDEGIGIPPEDLKRLFEPFHRATNVGTISGTGLGLSITKQAVELHGGSLTVESELNKGAQFMVKLPYRELVNAEER
jgi:PAS domain S-box-containing protein